MATTIIAPLSSITAEGLKAGTIPIPAPLLFIAVLGLVPSLPIISSVSDISVLGLVPSLNVISVPASHISVAALTPREAGPNGWQEDLVHFIGVKDGVTWNQSNGHAISFETGRSFVPSTSISTTSLAPTLNLVFAPVAQINVQSLTPSFVGVLIQPEISNIFVNSMAPLVLHRIDGPNIQSYGDKLQKVNYQYYGDAIAISSHNLQWYGDFTIPINASIQRYGNSVLSGSENEQVYDITIYPSSENIHIYNILNVVVGNSNIQEYDLDEYDTIRSANDQRYSLLTEDSNIQSYTLSAEVDGMPIELSSFNANTNVDSYAMSFQMQVLSPDDYDACVKSGIVTATINSIDFIFKIEGKVRRKVNGEILYTVSGLSPTCTLDVPYAETLTQVWDSDTSARSIIESLAAGFTVNWNIIEWTVKANTLFANDESPITIIRKILDAIGAVVTTTPDAELNIDSLYPISPPDWNTSTPDFTFSDELDIIQVEETFQSKPGYNSVIVSNEDILSSDYISIEEETVNANTKRLKVWYLLQSGGLPDSVELQTSGGSWVIIESFGQTEETLTETVEFLSGIGSTSKPIFSYDSSTIAWKQDSLGAVTFTENGSLSSEINGHSLLYIQYTTRYFEFLVTDPNIESVQFFVE